MTTVAPPICTHCKHLRRGGLTCAAFPDGIPQAILDSEHDHREPYEGDGGIRFEPTSERGARYAERLFDDAAA